VDEAKANLVGLQDGARWVQQFAKPDEIDNLRRIAPFGRFPSIEGDGLTPSDRLAIRISGGGTGAREARAFWEPLPHGHQYRDERAYLNGFLTGARQEVRIRTHR
jgi:hypothetical protein